MKLNTLKKHFLVFLCFFLYSIISNAKIFDSDRIHLPNFEIPSDFETRYGTLPNSYLETYPIKNYKIKLDKKKLIKLMNLFVAASRENRNKYGQDYEISQNCRILRMLEFNIGKIPFKREILFIGDVEKYIIKYKKK